MGPVKNQNQGLGAKGPKEAKLTYWSYTGIFASGPTPGYSLEDMRPNGLKKRKRRTDIETPKASNGVLRKNVCDDGEPCSGQTRGPRRRMGHAQSSGEDVGPGYRRE